MDYTGKKVRLTGPVYEHVPKESRECIVIGYTDSSKTTLKAKSSNGMVYNPFSPDTQVGECELIEETNQEALDRLQLQPGDIVKVVGDDNESVGWADPMLECKGQPQEVQEIDKEGYVSLWMPDKKINFWYNPQILEVVSRANDKQRPVQSVDQPDTNNHTILDTAKSLIYGDRLNDYGKTVDSFTSIAVGWSEIAKTPLTPEQVGLMMVWLKICRANNDNCKKEDNLIDIAGYAGCIEKIKKGL